MAAYIVHGGNAKSSLTGRVCSSRSRGQTVAGSVSLSSSTGIMSSAHRASKSSVSILENCMVSRMLVLELRPGGFGFRSADRWTEPRCGSSKLSISSKCEQSALEVLDTLTLDGGQHVRCREQ